MKQIGKPGGVVKVNIIVRLLTFGVLLDQCKQLVEGEKVKIEINTELVKKFMADGLKCPDGRNIHRGNI